MVNAGDIIIIDFEDGFGYEQKKKRPALVISNDNYQKFTTGLAIVTPISSVVRDNFPMHVTLDQRTVTVGQIQCEQLKTIDTIARQYEVIEKLPADLLLKVQQIVKSFY